MPGRIPDKFIEELLLRVDIVEVIDARVPLRKMGKDHKACCPFHEEKTPSFTVSPTKQFYHCFGCGAHGSAISFLMQYERMSFREACAELAGHVGLSIPAEMEAAPKDEAAADLLELLQQANRFYQRQLREHQTAHHVVAYLKRRGVSGEIAASFGLGYAPEGWDHVLQALGKDQPTREALCLAGLLVKKDAGGYYDRFRGRLMFPIHDYRGRIVGFGGRVIDDVQGRTNAAGDRMSGAAEGGPKYLNSPETPLFHKGRELYGLFQGRDAIKHEQRVLVVEGYMDVIALAQHGIPHAVATLGTATTSTHVERLFRFAPEILFCFDGDAAGREAAWRALESALPALRAGRQIGFLFLPDDEDPDTLVRREGAETFRGRLNQALPLPDFFFQTLAQQADLQRLDGRAKLVELARPLLSKLAPGVLKSMMLDRLAELSRWDAQKLGELLEKKEQARQVRSGVVEKTGGGQPPRESHTAPSLIRTALALLIQHPALAQEIPDATVLAGLQLPGSNLLQEVLQWLHSAPNLNTAALLEHFRDSEHQQSLAKLAVWQHPVLQHNTQAEFRDLVNRLRQRAYAEEAKRLLKKPGLNLAEKADLRRLLAEKHKLERSA